MYSTNFNEIGFEENLKLYTERVQEFQRYIKDKSPDILEKDLLSLRPKRVLGRVFLILNTERSMKVNEILRTLEERASSDKK